MSEDAAMKKLMEKWDISSDVSSVSSHNDTNNDDLLDYDDFLEQFRRTVTVSDNAIDQVILGTSDLDSAVVSFEKLTGVKPVWVASLNGAGVKSARMAFESCCFLELVGPDSSQENSAPLKEALSKLEPGKIVPIHYAFRNSEAYDMVKRSTLSYNQITMVAKDKGMPWTWDQYFLEGHNEGGIVPFVTNWKDSFHASGKLPIVGKLESVVVSAPAESTVHKLVNEVDGITLETGARKLAFTFSSPTGTHVFACESPIGITFPDEGGLPVKHP